MKKKTTTEHTRKKPSKASKPTGWQQQDPDYKQQLSNYDEPVPSRQLITEVLVAEGGPMTLDDLIGHFELTKLSEQEAFGRRLQAMVRDGQLAQNRRGAYGPVTQMNLIAGSIQAHRDGFGFLIPEAGGKDIFLPPRQMRSLMNGDRALVRVVGTDFKGRPEGVLVDVIERVSRSIVGRLHVDQGVSYVIPDNPRVQQDLLIPPEHMGGARHGQMVVAEIVTPPGSRTLPVGKVAEILGEHLAPGMEIEAAIRAHSLPNTWPVEVEREVGVLEDTVMPHQIVGREDLRELPLVTIDGADARDFDDAVHARAERKGWTLWVAIADVSSYVVVDSPLDKEAFRRATSVYFPQQVIPMLPEKLSNGLCSLNPDVDRLCMVCEMRVMPDGEVAKSRFYEAVMRSKARLIYDDVAAMLAEPQGEAAKKRPGLLKHLQTLNDVFDALFAARSKRGAIEFESTETRIVFSDTRKIERIVPVQRNLAHRLIEECMVAANVEAAKFVDKQKVPNLYRVHESPDLLKLSAVREFLALRGLRLGGGDKPTAKDYSKTLDAARARPDAGLIQTVMLRSMMQARYSPDNIGHFGLALTHYAHFTSPIRRYPDLMLHRGIKHALAKRKPKTFVYDHEKLVTLGAHCSMAERRADEATRDVTTWLKCEFMSDRVGEEFDGTISAVVPFGLFVELDGLFIEGLAHVSSLRNDYYEHDARSHRLVGSRSKTVYSLGDRVRIRLVRVNLDERKIDLELVQVTAHSSTIQRKPSESRRNRNRNKGKRT
ncbi:ribonuclease R [Sinimarinibacterium sp. CAU 1509]|uniref:ribonuclease R n=1 Tax=Sinimarinibacterium sp. CAU 1509 TaxID=2562283 RepID=UPI0010AD6457|nr:ribonuclease R [Sinimarinibacterium sp. CAU 1509]TJY60919.1 ribonuclease R [Sinimarinibacterium sp. CAU 1509]